MKNVDPGGLFGYMLHHIMMQNISKKSPQIAEVDDAFHCDDGTMRVFLAILSPSWGGAGAGARARGGFGGQTARFRGFSRVDPLKYIQHGAHSRLAHVP